MSAFLLPDPNIEAAVRAMGEYATLWQGKG